MSTFFSRYGRLLLLLLGALAMTGLVTHIGPGAIFRTLRAAQFFVPVILILEFSWMAFEGGAVRSLLGKTFAEVPVRSWREARLIHFATFAVVPMGRTSAEVTRAALLAKHVGKPRAACVGALMQSMTLSANAIVSALCAAVVYFSDRSLPLTLALLLNVAVTGSMGITMYAALRHVKLGGWAARKIKRLKQYGPALDDNLRETRPRHLLALMYCVGGRLLQTAQYGLIFYAVSRTFSPSSAFAAEGIQLVARSMGDMIPNQVGVTEAAFSGFSSALGLSEHPEKAISLALLGRVSNLSVAGGCAFVVQLMKRKSAS